MKKVKITKKKVMKLLMIVVAILIIFCISNIIIAIRRGNQYITITTSQDYYSNSKLSGGISVFDTKNNQITGNAKLELLDSNGKKVKGTNTNVNIKEGETTNFEFNIPELDEGKYYVKATVKTSKGKDIIKQVVNITDKNAVNVTTTLDKGIYKPGDMVNFRTLITSKVTDEPIKRDVNISIYDGNSNRVYNENISTSEFGIAGGKFQIADEVNSGTYKLDITLDNKKYSTAFIVNPYKIPKFETKLATDKEEYIKGENAKITIDSNYFFGEPVKNAQVKIYVDNEEKIAGVTNEQGKYEYNIVNLEAKKYNVKVEVTDESNYVVEESKILTVGTDLFEVELLPESGKLINNLNNQIYVFTKKSNGTPVKSYVTVQLGKITKQVATDENGIGSFNIDVDAQTTNYSYGSKNNKISNKSKQSCNIVAKDLENNEIRKTIDLQVSNDSIKISTNKLKYNIGEDIQISLDSNNDKKESDIYIYKNDKLLKTLSTTEDSLNVNLEDTYGIIDIYVTNKEYITNLSNAYKKTIYISPNKNMDIQISTDKEEYAPGENINISFDITQNGEKKDTALLVSMLDEAVLNLADNDMSIDNIKLALSDIKFTESLDAATLYTAIAENKSEQTIMGLLLKQESKSINIKNNSITGEEEKSQAIIKSIMSGIAILVIVVILAMMKNEKARNILKVIVSLFGIILAIYMSTFGVLFEIFNYENWIVMLIFSIAISILLYFAVVNKYKNSIFNTTLFSIMTCLIIAIIVATFNIIFNNNLDSNIFTSILIILAIIAIALVIAKKVIKDNEKIQKKFDKIFKSIISIGRLLVIGIISIIFTMIILSIMKWIIERFDGYGFWIEYQAVLIYEISFNIINILYNKYNKKSRYKKVLSIGTGVSLGLGIIIIFIIISIATKIFLQTGDVVNNASMNGSFEDYINQPNNPITVIPSYKGGTASVQESSKNIFSEIENAIEKFSTSKSETNITIEENVDSENMTTESTSNNEGNKQDEINNKVRNVFLESMCFIPELIAEKGIANIPLTLSDNITTWQIQTIGNTKDGTVGYSNKQVKVFKEFFVDYELPSNSYKGDKISIPVTIYNYTNEPKEVELKIVQSDWFSLNDIPETRKIRVEAKGTKMQYIPIEIKEIGKKVLRIEAKSGELQDIVEKSINIETNGYKKQNVVSSGTIKKDEIIEDILFLEDIVENSNKSVEVKLYSTPAAQIVEGMEKIFKMPTGCFEQVSSSLYPDIVTLKYMKDNNIIDENIKNKALNYINSGYQKLLTYEVKNEKGGYSLYGASPAETVLTAYGLMEIKDLSEVYNVDDNVISNMKEFLYKKQNLDGTFKITGKHLGGASSSNTVALNAYIIWALSEVEPKDSRLQSSIKYLEGKIEETTDNYTLALMANALANVGNKNASKTVNKILKTLNIDNNKASVISNIRDYYGSYGNVQTIQTTALTSMALSKLEENKKTNETFINYIISSKDVRGTWGTTQATTLAIKSLIEYNEKENIENQEITVKVNNDERKIQVGENTLDLYSLSFDNLEKENKLTINIPKGKIYYEVVQTYYVPYDKVDIKSNNIKIDMSMPEKMKVNEKVTAKLNIENVSDNDIENGQIVINIPQGFSVEEESLELLITKGLIEKYETNYREILIYLRNFEKQAYKELEVQFTPNYPVEVTGGSVRVYDYYNPTVEGLLMPRIIKVN